MATFNSASRRGQAAAIACFFACAHCTLAQTNDFAGQIKTVFEQTQRQFLSSPGNITNAWQFARACFDFADFAETKRERANTARQGIAACQQALAHDPGSAQAHYYLGMDDGQLARTETFGALKLVREMEREFKTAAQLDSQFDFAGPERNLGLLYRDAPGWPTSIGNRKKSREWLERAADIASDYPENHLNLIESFLKWNDRAAAVDEMQKLDALWPQAQKKFSDAKWRHSWADWKNRRDDARARLSENPKPLQAPHNR